jgi:AraC-like DNA-binding protein/tetratricopeptide (TPR) repeat protein
MARMFTATRISSSSTPLPRGVRRALEAMRAEAGREWSVADLAAVAGLSGRTLQRQFRIFLGQSPHSVLRDIRFDCARRELLRVSPGARVMDVALRWGFTHFGRFSIEYRRRYGETPSRTLKRQAAFIDALASMPPFLMPDRDRPTVALAPIETSPEDAEVARGIADELATALTRAGVALVNQQRGARYHLTGVLRKSDGQPRLSFRLLEAETGRYVWAHRADGVLGNDLVLEEHHATRIAAALQPNLRLAEIERARRKPEIDLSAHDLTLRAMPHALSLDSDGNARAIDLLDRAMDLDPNNALATALAAWAHAQRVIYHFSETPLLERTRGVELARKALALGGDATALALLGNALTSLHDVETADLVIRKALSVDGGSAWAWSRSGWIDVYKGDADSAIERFMIALELAPQDSLAFNNFVGIGVAHFNAGRYLEAARWQERALAEHPTAGWVHRTMCPAYVLAGAEAEARRSLAGLREHYPDLTVSGVQQGLPPLRPAVRELVFDALETIGLPA